MSGNGGEKHGVVKVMQGYVAKGEVKVK